MKSYENYVCKKEVDWSLLTEGLTLPNENQVVFGRNMGKFLQRGETKVINLFLNGETYNAKISNVNFDERFHRKNDTLQIRYPKNGDLSNALKFIFSKSYKYISDKRRLREQYDRSMIRLPEDYKEYLIIYTTEYEDTYKLETIVAEEIYAIRDLVKEKSERIMESNFNFDIVDDTSTIVEDQRIVKIRKLSRAIGDNLKLAYDYRCQICGQKIGELYDSHIIEAHHIDYFVNSLNNDMNNIMIVCPDHHSIIHDVNPIFDKPKKLFIYNNGFEEGLKLNCHL
jgi:hypothetical protein